MGSSKAAWTARDPRIGLKNSNESEDRQTDRQTSLLCHSGSHLPKIVFADMTKIKTLDEEILGLVGP